MRSFPSTLHPWPSTLASNHLHAPQIVEVDQAFYLARGVYHNQGRDLAFLEDCKCGGGEFIGGDGARIRIHGIGRRAAERGAALALEQTAQVAVADHAAQAAL